MNLLRDLCFRMESRLRSRRLVRLVAAVCFAGFVPAFLFLLAEPWSRLVMFFFEQLGLKGDLLSPTGQGAFYAAYLFPAGLSVLLAEIFARKAYLVHRQLVSLRTPSMPSRLPAAEEPGGAAPREHLAGVEEPVPETLPAAEPAGVAEPVSETLPAEEAAVEEEEVPAPEAVPLDGAAEVEEETGEKEVVAPPEPAAREPDLKPAEVGPFIFPSRLWGWARAKSIIGIDIGTGAVKMVQCQASSGVVRVTSISAIPTPPGWVEDGLIPDPDRFARWLFDQVGRMGVAGTRTVLSVNAERSVIRQVALPRMEQRELQEALRWEAENYLPFPAEEAVIDFQVMDSPSGKASPEGPGSPTEANRMPVLLVACEREIISRLTRLSEKAGFPLIAIEPTTLSAGRAIRTAGLVGAAETIAVVDLGVTGTRLALFRDKYPVFHRNMTVSVFSRRGGGPRLGGPEGRPAEGLPGDWSVQRPESASAVSDTLLDNLFFEIRRSIDVAAVQTSVSSVQVILVGGGAGIPGLRERMGKYLHQNLGHHMLPEEGDLVRVFEITDDTPLRASPSLAGAVKNHAALLVTALGLALWDSVSR